jgi:anti-sigma regulatory factor (Ser/Thr protein kinase)
LDDDMTAVCITRVADPGTPHSTAESGKVTPDVTGHCDLLPTAEASSGPPSATAAVPLILTSRNPAAMATGLSPPYNGFLEITSAGLGDVGAACFEAAERGGLCLSLAVASAWSCGVANLLGAALRQRYGDDRDWHAVDFCLSEAIGNAIIHGCLGLESGLRETASGLELYDEAIRQRLRDPVRSALRVEVTIFPLPNGQLEIAVHDRGAGFDLDRYLNDAVSQGAKHGRGLALIRKIARSIASRDGGRTLVITI